MCNLHNGPPLHLLINHPPDLLIRLSIHATSRFIEQHHVRSRQQCSREAEELLLPDREAQLIHVGVQTAPGLDDGPDGRLAQDVAERLVGLDLVLGVEVVADGAGELEGVLGEGCEVRADLLAGDGGEVEGVDSDGAGAEFEEAEEG